jgi:hypothetical protein
MGEDRVGALMSLENRKSDSTFEVMCGIGLSAALHILFFSFFWLLLRIAVLPVGFGVALGIAILAIGVVQLLYVVPTYLYLRKKERRGVAKGLLVGASITLLLNSACWGWLIVAKPRMGG